MARINFVVDDEQKALYEEYMNSDPEFESLSHFFRVAAIREMQEDESNETPTEILDRLDRIENDISELTTKIEGVNARLDADDTDIELLADEVRQTLQKLPQPSPSEVSQSDKNAEKLQRQFAYPIVEADHPTTAEELAQHLGEDRDDIEQAIEHLRSSHIPVVDKVLDDGKKHYFKESERR